jgi:hypothetical protein
MENEREGMDEGRLAGMTPWTKLENELVTRESWTDDEIYDLLDRVSDESVSDDPAWNRLEIEIERFREWPTPRLADLVHRVLDGDDPSEAGQTELISEGE